MPLFLLLLAVAVIGGIFAVAVGRVRGGLDEPVSSLPYRPLPEGRLSPDDVDAVRFSLGFRGYRMDEVDDVLNRLAAALTDRDDEIRGLRQRLHAAERSSGTAQRAEPTGNPAEHGPTGT